MKRTVYLLGTALVISIIVFLSSVKPVRAYMDEDDVWSEPNGYAHAYVRGSWYRFGYPYYAVHHEADIFETLKGRAHFIGWDKNGNVLYNVWRYFSGTLHEEYAPPYYNVIQAAMTETWAPYSYPPSPYQEYAAAIIEPPGAR
ncbi:MAG: hypothetical protein QXD70_04035 [Candidatus Bathyarchaeia archaeon]